MSAFDNGRVGLWVNNPANLSARLTKVAAFANGMFTDVFLPRTATPTHMGAVRATVRPDGTHLHAQLWEQAGSLSASALAAQVDADITRLMPGVVELDIEVSDGSLAQYLRDVVNALRLLRPSFLLRLNVAPNKAGFLPSDLLSSDPWLYASEQTYFGDMSRKAEDECLLDLQNHAPPEKVALCYGAAAPDLQGVRHGSLGSIYYKGQATGKLARGLVFSDDLMAEAGYL